MRNPIKRKRDMKNDVYSQVTDRIIADLEKGELTWLKPWSAGSVAGRITRPLLESTASDWIDAISKLQPDVAGRSTS